MFSDSPNFNALVYGATIFSAAFVTQHVTRSRLMATIASLLVLTSFPTYDQSSYFWTRASLYPFRNMDFLPWGDPFQQLPTLKRYVILAGGRRGFLAALRCRSNLCHGNVYLLNVGRGTFKERFTRTFIFGF